jgi:hypothetical protein
MIGLAASLFPGCRAAPTAPREFAIFFTCDTKGRIEPCGCFTGQYGGLTRVSTVLRAEGGPEAFVVEVGNAIGGLEDYHRLQFRHLLEACGEMGYAAVNLGAREARLPAEALLELAAASPVPLLSANVLDADSGASIAAPSLVVERGGLRIGLVGVVDPDRLGGPPGDGLRVGGVREALRREVDALRGKADVLVCLAFADEGGLEAIAGEFYEFDFVLGGDVRQPSSALARVNRSWILATTNEARALGEIRATFDPSAGRTTGAEGDIRLMVDTIPEDPGIREHSALYRREVREAVLEIDRLESQAGNRVPGVAPAATYVGSQTCAACHPTAHGVWGASAHARAFESLVATGSDADPACIGCHTVGFGEPGGYVRSMNGGLFAGVGCESCHGPGSEHVALRSAAGPGGEVALAMRPVGQGQCLQCHHGEFSRPFDWDAFWPLVEHLKEGALAPSAR